MGAKAAKAPSIFWSARYRKAHKKLPPPPHGHHPREGVVRTTLQQLRRGLLVSYPANPLR